MIINYEKKMILLTKIFVFIMLFQYLVFNVVLKNIEILQYGKEVVFLIMLVLFLGFEKFKINSVNVFLLITFAIFLVINGVFFSPISAFVFIARKYLFPLMFGFILFNSDVFKKRDNIVSLVRFVFYISIVVSLFGIFQAFVLGDKFLLDLGYLRDPSGQHLSSTYYFGNNFFIQRVTSVLASPNVLAGYLSIVIVLVNYFRFDLKISKKWFAIGNLILIITLLLTFSRSFILGLIVALLVVYHVNIKVKFKVVIAAIVLVVVGNFAFMAIFDRNLIMIVLTWITNTLTGQESSSAGRSGIWLEAIRAAIGNPFGIGLGRSGINAYSLYHGMDIKVYATENSYISLLLDVGIIGALAYILLLIRLTLNIDGRKVNSSLLVLLLTIMVSFIFSNYIYDLEILLILFISSALIKNSMSHYIERNNVNLEKSSS